MTGEIKDKIIGGPNYTLSCLKPGTYYQELEPNQNLLDIYLGGSEGSFVRPPCSDAPLRTAPNSFCFLPAGTAKEFSTIRCGFSIRFTFKLDAIRIIPARETLRASVEPIWNHLDVAMLGAAEITKDYLHAPNHTVKNVETSFLRDLLAVRILQIATRPDFRPSVARPLPVQRSIEFIDNHLADPLHLEHISSHVNTSQFHFARMFRSVMGVSVRRYVILRRIEVAQRMISHTDTSLAEVAYAAGFSSQSHMTSVFRRFTGRTPATYRTMVSSRLQKRA